jgi:TIR domain
VRENQLLTLIFSTTSVILLLLAYFLVNSNAALMMPSPTPTPYPTTTNMESAFVLIGLAIIVAGAVIAIYFFYSKNKNRKIYTVSESKFTAVRGSKAAGEVKIDTSDKVSRPFEVFLCYKKSSGKDYADHLKTGLEELGLHTFEDCKDIPQTVDTEEGWACSRDKALEESKYFILIMTPGFDLSHEVANEIRMARKQTNKTFVYFRHRSMGRNIVVNFGDELFDISKLEQVSFETKEELLRLAHSILLKAKAS